MEEQEYPIEYTLESGTHVIVNPAGSKSYHFTLKPEEGPVREFTYTQDGRTKEEAEKHLEFDEQNALRRFWLETEDIL